MSSSKRLKVIKHTSLILNKYIEVFEDVFNNGTTYYIASFSKFGGVEIVALVNGKKILLVSKEREAVLEKVYSLPGGKIDQGESPENAAKRELSEETGYCCKRVSGLGEVYISPARSTDKVHMFFGKAEYNHKPKPKEEAERDQKYELFKVDDVMKMIREGKIQDAVSVAAILLAKEKRVI